ncbi:MAG: class I SAM-dependent methyltransferase [Candidatus Giovannonibacteria bacterium]|nr:MAG: class I SAM-dependent methyltransferase [Candidatus Giovannonibacteria bacterium]
MKCQICGNKKLESVLNLGHQPIVQAYLTKQQLGKPEMTYPLNLCRCAKCGLLQLDSIIAPELVFPKNYPYRTGLTNMLIRNFRELAGSVEKKYNLSKNDLIIDIGSNDGTLLQGFKEKGVRVLGIEPTDAAKDANKRGIPTIQEYFTQSTAKKILKKYGKAKIVTATNTFAHIPNPVELTKNIKNVLAPDGVFVSESQYLMDIVEKFEFDTIYHEHLRFYSLKPLIKLFALAGMSLIDAERISAAGGSIRVYAAAGKKKMSERAKKLIRDEERAGLYDPKNWARFRTQAISAKNNLLKLLIDLKQKRAKIAGITSSARSNTLLGFTKIDSRILDYSVEKAGSPKIGLFTPGTHIPVLEENKLFKDQPDYALVLSWHIGEELMKILRKNGYKGKFIMPLPTPKIIK